MRLYPEGFHIPELISRIDRGKVALPEFQRDFEWRPPAVAELLLSIARRWPIGSFLLLEIGYPPPFAIRQLAEAPLPDTPDRLILDGQQRSTAVYHAFGGHSKEVYYVDLGKLRADGELDEDHLRFAKGTVFNKRMPNVKAMAEARIAKVSTLISPLEWQQWLNYVGETEREQLVALKEDQLPGLSAYEIPALRLESPPRMTSRRLQRFSRRSIEPGRVWRRSTSWWLVFIPVPST